MVGTTPSVRGRGSHTLVGRTKLNQRRHLELYRLELIAVRGILLYRTNSRGAYVAAPRICVKHVALNFREETPKHHPSSSPAPLARSLFHMNFGDLPHTLGGQISACRRGSLKVVGESSSLGQVRICSPICASRRPPVKPPRHVSQPHCESSRERRAGKTWRRTAGFLLGPSLLRNE
jgi:hypothetical protein